MCAGRSETICNHVDSDAEIPADMVQRTIRKLELVCLQFINSDYRFFLPTELKTAVCL